MVERHRDKCQAQQDGNRFETVRRSSNQEVRGNNTCDGDGDCGRGRNAQSGVLEAPDDIDSLIEPIRRSSRRRLADVSDEAVDPARHSGDTAGHHQNCGEGEGCAQSDAEQCSSPSALRNQNDDYGQPDMWLHATQCDEYHADVLVAHHDCRDCKQDVDDTGLTEVVGQAHRTGEQKKNHSPRRQHPAPDGALASGRDQRRGDVLGHAQSEPATGRDDHGHPDHGSDDAGGIPIGPSKGSPEQQMARCVRRVIERVGEMLKVRLSVIGIVAHDEPGNGAPRSVAEIDEGQMAEVFPAIDSAVGVDPVCQRLPHERNGERNHCDDGDYEERDLPAGVESAFQRHRVTSVRSGRRTACSLYTANPLMHLSGYTW